MCNSESLSQVYFDEDPKVTDVYKRDLFHHLFRDMVSNKSGMFNDSETLAWFPTNVRLKTFIQKPDSESTVPDTSPVDSFVFAGRKICIYCLYFINADNKGGQYKLLPVWVSVWIGIVQQQPHTFTIPTGSV